MKKYRKQIYRITSLLCSIVLIVSLAAFPAYATSDDFSNDNFIELLDYDSVGGGSNSFSFAGSTNVTLDNPNNGIVNYVEILYFQSGQALNNVRLLVGNNYATLGIVSYGNGIYKAYTSTNANMSDVRLQFNNGSTSYSYITLLSCKISQLSTYNFGETTSFNIKYDIGAGLNETGISATATMPAVGSKTLVNFNTHTSADGFYNFVSNVDLNGYGKYDYVDILMQARVATIDSIVASWNGVNLPITVSYLFTDKFGSYVIDDDLFSWSDSHGDIVNINVRVDLRGFKRGTSVIPTLTVRGSYDCQYNDNYFALLNYTGLLSVPQKSPLLNLWYQLQSKLDSNHSDLKYFLSDIFVDNDAAQQAQQTQEQINVEVNAQVSDAVADWDVHITEVQDGYDSGFEGAVPALTWLSSLAEGIFGNMGWFGSIYMLVGLVSVYVLFLNKGGLIGRKLK